MAPSTHSRRNLLKASGATLTAISVGGCLGGTGGSGDGGGPVEMKLALAVPQWTLYGPVRLAEQKGYFEEFNVDATVTAYPKKLLSAPSTVLP